MMKHGVVIIVNAVIWGLVILGCSLALKGTGMYEKIQLILGGGAAFSIILLGAGMPKRNK
jgi:hypothetical protein